MQLYINGFFLFKPLPLFKKSTNNLQLCFSKNILLDSKLTLIFKQSQFNLILGNKLSKFTKILSTIFKLNKNVILVDYDYNYNYLPIQNSDLFSRSSKNFNKCISYFNVSAVVFLNLNKKKFILKKLFTSKTINVSIDSNVYSNKFDLGIQIQNTNITRYLIYIHILNIYLNVKNNNLNINDSKLLFF